MSAKRTAFLAGLAVLLLAGGAVGQDRDLTERVRESVKRSSCLNNLRQIGALLTMLEAEGKLEHLEGPSFLLQVAPRLDDEDLDVFLFPAGPRFADFAVDPEEAAKAYREDWRTAPCSYLGPDKALLDEIRRGEARPNSGGSKWL